MFPTLRFRMAYDSLMNAYAASVATKIYLKVLPPQANRRENSKGRVERMSHVSKQRRSLLHAGKWISPNCGNLGVP
jgi:hypothetical protein